MRKYLLLMILIPGIAINSNSPSDTELLQVITKVMVSKSIDEVKNEVTNNFCTEKTLVVKDEFYYCDLSKKLIKRLYATSISSSVEDFYYDEELEAEIGEFSIRLTGYGYEGISYKSNRKRKKRLESDFEYLKLQLANKFQEVGYHFRENGEAPELEEITYEIIGRDNRHEFKMSKIRGGCFGQAKIFLHFEIRN